MTRDDIQKEFDEFIEFPTEEKSFVTTTSALLFAEHIAAMSAKAEREACLLACEAIETDRWALYKGWSPYKGTEDGRASEHTQGQSDGASDCAAAIKARSNA